MTRNIFSSSDMSYRSAVNFIGFCILTPADS